MRCWARDDMLVLKALEVLYCATHESRNLAQYCQTPIILNRLAWNGLQMERLFWLDSFELLFLLQLKLIHIVFECHRNSSLNAIKIWSPLLCSSACRCVWAACLPSDELMPLCPQAPATQYDSYIFTVKTLAHTQNTNIFQRQEHSLSLVLCIHLKLYTRTHLSGTTKHDKNSILCSTVLIMMLISMCPPNHNSDWLDWLHVQMTRGNLCLTDDAGNKSHALRSDEQSTVLIIIHFI